MMILLFFVLVIKCVNPANILFVTLLPSPSHHIWNEALVVGLLKNGHNITLIGHDKPRYVSDNYTVLEIEGLYEILSETYNATEFASMDSLKWTYYLWDFYLNYCDYDLKSKALKVLLEYPRDAFDMIIMDLNGVEHLYPLVDYFKNPPVIGVSAFGLPPSLSDSMGAHLYSYIPHYTSPYGDRMTFFQRINNQLHQLVEIIARKYSYLPVIEEKVKKIFGENVKPFKSFEDQIALLLCSVDPVLNFPQSLPPNIIPVGGLHLKPAKQLPNDLQDIMDKATKGVIFVSFGTNIKSKHIDEDKMRALVDTFAKLPYVILWKFEDENLKLPKNVIRRKWFPQNDILGHKNIKLFITHGGALSTQEAMYHGVPVVGIPIIIDQFGNMGRMQVRKLGKKVDFLTLSSETLYNAVVEVLDNEMYHKNMKDISRKFRDQLETPLERGVFWVEYILRHGNANHLHIAGKYMSVFQTLNLDILVLLILILCLIILAIRKTCQMVSKSVKKKTE